MTGPTIHATLTRCRHGQALIELDGGPFHGVEIRPGELREMAQALSAIAALASQLPLGGRHWRPTQVQVGAKRIPEAG